MKNVDIVMILLESLPTSFEYLITAMKLMPMKELMMNYVTTCLMHEMSKLKEKKPKVVMSPFCCDKINEQLISMPRHKIVLLFVAN